MTPTQFAARLDHTINRPDALSSEVHRVTAEAMQLGLGGVVAPPIWTARLARMLQGSGVRTVSLVGFPNGTNKPTIKAIEATSTIKEGADVIEVVPHLAGILSLDLDGARAELMEIVRAARSTRRDVVINVTVDIATLLARGGDRAERMIETACRAVRESGGDGIVINDQIARVKPYAESLTIKMAMIENPAAARAAMEAGADRVGTGDARVICGISSNEK